MERLSKFNIVRKVADNKILIANTLTGAVACVERSEFEAVHEWIKQSASDHKNSHGGKQELIAQMRNGGFLIQDKTDEFQLANYLFNYCAYSSQALDLRILPTEDCNFRCAYCYETFAQGEMNADVRERLKKLVRRRARQLKTLNVGWFGGEPLLAMDTILDLSREFLRVSKENDFVYDAHMTSNGYKLDERTFRELLSLNVRRSQITIDGFGEAHDKRRHSADGNGTFDCIIGNLEKMMTIREPFQLQVRVNFDRENLSSVPQLLDLLAKITQGDKRFDVFFRKINNWSAAVNGARDIGEELLIDHYESIRIQLELESEANKRGLKVQTGFSPPMLASFLCYAAYPNSYSIGSDGSVYKCTVYFDESINKVGIVDETGELKLDVRKIAQWVELSGQSNDACTRCVLYPSCQGRACPAAMLIQGSCMCPVKVSHVKNGLVQYYKQHAKPSHKQ